jgi:hypothetical protein
MKQNKKLQKILALTIISILLGVIALSIAIAEDPTTEERWDDPMWYNDQDFSTIIEGSKKNPDLMSDPFFFSLFEEKVQANPDVLNNDYDALLMFGQQIGVVFTQGAGIGNYDSMTRQIRTKGCIDMACEGKEVIFSAFDISPMINPDGSIYVDELGGEVEGVKISMSGKNIEISGHISHNGMINIDTKILRFNTDDSKDAKIVMDENGIFHHIKGGLAIYENTEITNEFYQIKGDKYSIDLRNPDTPVIAYESGKEVVIETSLTPDDYELRSYITLSKGSVNLEDAGKYLFNENTEFKISPGHLNDIPDHKVHTMNNKLRYCVDRSCYGKDMDDMEPSEPSVYKNNDISTIETFDYPIYPNTKGNDKVLINVVKGELEIEQEHSQDVTTPLKGLTTVIKHKGSGDVKISEKGTFKFEDETQPFYYGVTIDEKEYMIRGEVDTTMGGSNIVITRADEESYDESIIANRAKKMVPEAEYKFPPDLDGVVIEFTKPHGKIDIKPVTYDPITNEISEPYKPVRGIVFEDEPDIPIEQDYEYDGEFDGGENDPYTDYQPPVQKKNWRELPWFEKTRILTNPDNYNEYGYGPTDPYWEPDDELNDCAGSGEICG